MQRVMVDVLVGGPGREAAVSRQSGATIVDALAQTGHDVRLLEIGERLEIDRLREHAIVFNIIHGTYGEDGTLQQELEEALWAYIGSDAAASRLCMDKAACKARLAEAGLAVVPGMALAPAVETGWDGLELARGVVVKPAADGSSVGLAVLDPGTDPAPAIAALRADLGPVTVLVEERLPGPEYTVAVLEGNDGQLQALTPIEIVSAGGTYDYAAKYERDDTRYNFVTDTALSEELRGSARRAFAACGCRDMARIDFMADGDGRPCILEINTLPGFTDHSLVPMAAAHDGLPLPFLCDHLVLQAATRRRCRCHLHGHGAHPEGGHDQG